MAENLGCTFWKVLNPDPSKSLRFICRRKLNQAQAKDARKLRTMVVNCHFSFIREFDLSIDRVYVRETAKAKRWVAACHKSVKMMLF